MVEPWYVVDVPSDSDSDTLVSGYLPIDQVSDEDLLSGDTLAEQIEAEKSIPKFQPGFIYRDCEPHCPLMLVLGKGAYQIGGDLLNSGGSYAMPIVDIQINTPFSITKNEITKAQYAFFVDESNYQMEPGCVVFVNNQWQFDPQASWKNPGFEQGDDEPVVCVSYNDAIAYANWLSEQDFETSRLFNARYRLLSESEWEYAARGGSPSSYFWGDEQQKSCQYANLLDQTALAQFKTDASQYYACEDDTIYTRSIGAYKGNGFGLNDMIGNVSEWVSDCWHSDYEGRPVDEQAWNSDDCTNDLYVIRGGAWVSGPGTAFSSTRSRALKNSRIATVGIRLGQTLNIK
ncbi:MAG: SUMF1/EgtB/PvdO family nonheme iron enzyme [Pseudomonadota bacterium]